jgi:hypothetical protein
VIGVHVADDHRREPSGLEALDQPCGDALAAVQQQRTRVSLDQQAGGRRIGLRGSRATAEDRQAHVEPWFEGPMAQEWQVTRRVSGLTVGRRNH